MNSFAHARSWNLEISKSGRRKISRIFFRIRKFSRTISKSGRRTFSRISQLEENVLEQLKADVELFPYLLENF